MQSRMNNKILYMITLYGILNSFVVLVYCGKSILFSPTEMTGFAIDLFLFVLFLSSLITNFYLLKSSLFIKQFLKYNLILYGLQIFHFKILGLVLNFSCGLVLLPILTILHQSVVLEFSFHLLKMIFTIWYSNHEEGLIIGLSIIPLLQFLAYWKLLNAEKKFPKLC
jgi:hypothetical protein